MRATPDKSENKSDTKSDIIVEGVVPEFNPSDYIKNWDNLPSRVREIKMRPYNRDSDGRLLPTNIEVSESKTDNQIIKVRGVSGSLTLEQAKNLRDALDESITEVEKS